MSGKIKDKHPKVPQPFGQTVRMTERSGVAVLMHWMRGIIENRHLDLGLPDVETKGADGKLPDLVIYESRRSRKVLCLIEAKPPYYDVFNEPELKEPARRKANDRLAKYFGCTNFKKLIWYNTEKVNAHKPEEEQIVDKYVLSEIEHLNDLEQTRHRDPISKALERFLSKLYKVHTGQEAEPKQAVDEWLIFRIQEKVRVLSGYYRSIIDDKCHKDAAFAKKMKTWFVDQGWSFTWQSQDFDKVARQTAYLLINKILFYNLLQAKRPEALDPLEVTAGLSRGSRLQNLLQGYFNDILQIDYETIYTTDFIDEIAFPEAREVVQEVKDFINIIGRYDFSTLGYDILGRIFESLIPRVERQNLGQYFTSPDVVDLILNFCLQHEDDRILDPGCGAGTFLVRAYQNKKVLNQLLRHEEVIETLWGVDIAKFPAHLATINLAVNDLGVDNNYPNILHQDFFSLLVKDDGFELPEHWRQARARTLGREVREVIFPRWFDAVVGNPPYTRQEKIQEIGVDKGALIGNALKDLSGKKMANIGKRAGIYAYFFIHGAKFLKDQGHFGFIVSNSWLDVDYGKGLQEFFLNHFKIIAVIESKVERWFEAADINTCIVILQKCGDKAARDANLVRFVYLKKPLRSFIPPAQDMWEKQVERFSAIDRLKKTILAHGNFYENQDLRIFPKSQSELWAEGYDAEEEKYAGAKWGKYLRAPEIFFKIIEKSKAILVPIKEIAEIRRGFTTGANEFFYLTEEDIKRRGIEREFWMHQDQAGNWVPNYVVKSPRECKSIIVKPDDLNYRVIMVHKDQEELRRTKILKYIKEGERKGFNKRPTCESRGKRWYDLGKRQPGVVLWEMVHFERLKSPYNETGAYVDHNLFEIFINPNYDDRIVSAQLNSTMFGIIREIWGRSNLGLGSLKTEGVDIEKFPVINPDAIPSDISQKLINAFNGFILREETESIFVELGADTVDQVSLDRIKADRRELDAIILGDILGLTEAEQLEVYRAVIDLVQSRVGRARSVDQDSKIVDGVDFQALSGAIVNDIKNER